MNIVVVTDEVGVDVYKKWSDMNKTYKLEKKDFVKYADDYVCYMDEESHRVSKDIKLLEDYASRQIFGKPKMDTLTVFGVAAINIILFTIYL